MAKTSTMIIEPETEADSDHSYYNNSDCRRHQVLQLMVLLLSLLPQSMMRIMMMCELLHNA